MFRLLGFLVGFAATMAIMLWLLGVPRLDLDSGAPPEADGDGEQVDEKQPEMLAAAPPDTETFAESQNTMETALAETTDTPDLAGPGSEPKITPPHDTVHGDALPDPLSGRHWYVFWKPFRSEIAARGFIARLERVTGLDYRIVKVKSGVYEVSFAYGSDAELDRHLSQIHAATGLDLHAE
jgi:hypothetical protein